MPNVVETQRNDVHDANQNGIVQKLPIKIMENPQKICDTISKNRDKYTNENNHNDEKESEVSLLYKGNNL